MQGMILISLKIHSNYKCEEDDYIVQTKNYWNTETGEI